MPQFGDGQFLPWQLAYRAYFSLNKALQECTKLTQTTMDIDLLLLFQVRVTKGLKNATVWGWSIFSQEVGIQGPFIPKYGPMKIYLPDLIDLNDDGWWLYWALSSQGDQCTLFSVCLSMVNFFHGSQLNSPFSPKIRVPHIWSKR